MTNYNHRHLKGIFLTAIPRLIIFRSIIGSFTITTVKRDHDKKKKVCLFKKKKV